MRLTIFLVPVIIIQCTSGIYIDCEKFRRKAVGTKHFVTCYLNSRSSIYSTGFLLSSPKNENVQAISFSYNQKISFLPERIAEMFPNSVIIYSSGCAIQSISNIVFNNLNKLERLYLKSNKITRIDGDVFDGLTALRRIELSKLKLIGI